MITIQGVLIFSLLPLLYTAWIFQVNKIVPVPYLDEVFHARQAQAYCAGKFKTWDPKITTPLGLYVLSYLFAKTKQLIFSGDCCDLPDLRGLNSLTATYFIPCQLWDLYGQLGLRRRHGQNEGNISHTIANICLFPLLLFFSGLYYTDVCSVSFVLGAYQYHVRSLRDASTPRIMDALCFLVLGIGALLMRQTNIFWVAIFFAGLQAVHQVKRSSLRRSKKNVKSLLVTEAIHDPPISDAYLEDYVKTAFYLARAAIRDPIPLLLSLWPYLALLALFAIFVLVNGGVVLGDKENHIASIHLPQMLYIWAYIFFFSWPVVLPHILHLLSTDTKALKSRLPRPIVAISIMALMTLAVHFNTIVHPFTLADNRHYVFYVFRLLLRHSLVKYAAVPVYFICAWAALTALGNRDPSLKKEKQQGSPEPFSAEPNPPPSPLRTSFLLVFLISTTLSVTTAPLVEPRYFILPWLIWRLHVVPPPPSPPALQTQPTWAPPLLRHILQPHSSTWLYIETAWFLLVDLATCYMFLYKGFAWKQEPGKVQRFMW